MCILIRFDETLDVGTWWMINSYICYSFVSFKFLLEKFWKVFLSNPWNIPRNRHFLFMPKNFNLVFNLILILVFYYNVVTLLKVILHMCKILYWTITKFLNITNVSRPSHNFVKCLIALFTNAGNQFSFSGRYVFKWYCRVSVEVR